MTMPTVVGFHAQGVDNDREGKGGGDAVAS
jgi:hypothetical protein